MMLDLFGLLFTIAQGVTRGAAEPQLIPLQDGPLGPQINWTQLLAAIGVFVAVHAGVMRYIVSPAIADAIAKSVMPVQAKVVEMDKSLDALRQEMKLRVEQADDVHQQFHESLRELRNIVMAKESES